MKIVADDRIPFLKGVLEPFAEIIYRPGHLISAGDVGDADALLIRTRTRCDEKLLKDSRVSFIGTATIGYDHIDTNWCEEQGIVWKNAPGCNATSVYQYVASALFTLSHRLGFSLKDRTLGVVGVGHVGSKIVRLAELLDMRVYLCDPPRVRNEGICGFISLDGIIRECDLITFHVPLNRDGIDRTWHLINNGLLEKVNPGTIMLNTSRGEVADEDALRNAVKGGRISGLVLDVWNHEPAIDLELMRLCTLATPHIAGYSADGKANGTAMIIRELSRHFNLGLEDWETSFLPEPVHPEISINCQGMSAEAVLSRAVLHTYAVAEDDRRLREAPENFEKQRGDYPVRREFRAYTLKLGHAGEALKRTCRKLGFTLSD